jgi:hypothetical protein
MLPAIPTVTALANAIRAGATDPAKAVADALAKGRPDEAIAAVLAGSVAERALDARLIEPLVPTVTDLLAIPVLVASAGGDRVAMLLDLVEADSMTSDREAMALFLAATVGFGRRTTQLARFHTLLRLVARRCSGGDDASLLLAAGGAAKDAGAVRVVSAVANLADAEGDAFVKDVLHAFEHPRDVLPKEAARWLASGYTATRAAPKVGRNDPCPCGSGKKYKKCCEGKPVPAGAGEPGAVYTRAPEVLTPDRVNDLTVEELAAIDLATFPPDALVTAMRRFALFRRWDEAERALDALLARGVPDTDRDGLREELIVGALDVKQLEVAKRIRAKIEGELDPVVALRLELQAPTKHTVAHVDALARESLRTDPTLAIDLAYGLLVTHPALGIHFARGVIDPRRPLDSEILLDKIEEARDVLALAPGDAWQSIYDEALDRDVVHHAAQAEATSRGEELAAEAERLRGQAKLASSRVAELEARLREQERALKDAAPRSTASTTHPAPSDEEERKRLRTKVEELKARIAEGNEERASLRKELTRRNDELVSAAAQERARPTKEEIFVEEPGDAAAAPRELLIPRFTRAAESTLRAMPSRTARDAFDTIGALATGDANAWAEVKRLARLAAPVYEGRIGIHYRVLFAIESKGLEVLDVVHRKDLRGAVDRLM